MAHMQDDASLSEKQHAIQERSHARKRTFDDLSESREIGSYEKEFRESNLTLIQFVRAKREPLTKAAREATEKCDRLQEQVDKMLIVSRETNKEMAAMRKEIGERNRKCLRYAMLL
jgi:hypothetical protein